MHYLCEKILTFEKCFAITENAEITVVGLQTLEQTSTMSSEREKNERSRTKTNPAQSYSSNAKKRQKNILDYYRLREQRCILKMIPLICKHAGILVVKGEILKSS